MINYAKLYGISLTQAKKNCVKWFGRLPHEGEELLIMSTHFRGKYNYEPNRFNVYIVNVNGKYSLRESKDVSE